MEIAILNYVDADVQNMVAVDLKLEAVVNEDQPYMAAEKIDSHSGAEVMWLLVLSLTNYYYGRNRMMMSKN